MADHERTEAPTPKRRAEARKKGQVARSVEVSAAIGLVVAFVVLQASGGTMFQQLRTLMVKTFQPGTLIGIGDHGFAAYGSLASATFISAMTPLFFGLVVTGVAVNMAQTRMLFSMQSLSPSFSKLNPLKGLQRMFSGRSLVELAKALGKLAVCGFLGYQILAEKYSSFLPLENANLAASVGLIAGVAIELGFKIGAALIAMAALDYMYQRQTFEKNLRMSHQEL
jgi:flagellar biosynthesis protein FlhB